MIDEAVDEELQPLTAICTRDIVSNPTDMTISISSLCSPKIETNFQLDLLPIYSHMFLLIGLVDLMLDETTPHWMVHVLGYFISIIEL